MLRIWEKKITIPNYYLQKHRKHRNLFRVHECHGSKGSSFLIKTQVLSKQKTENRTKLSRLVMYMCFLVLDLISSSTSQPLFCIAKRAARGEGVGEKRRKMDEEEAKRTLWGNTVPGSKCFSLRENLPKGVEKGCCFWKPRSASVLPDCVSSYGVHKGSWWKAYKT